MEQNPYAPPTIPDSSEPVYPAEAVRQQHLRHEVSVKSIGAVFLLGGSMFVLYFMPMIRSVITVPGSTPASRGAVPVSVILIGLVFLFLSIVQIVTAIGLWRLQRWSRPGATILAVFGLLVIPIGTIVSLYAIYILLSPKGRVVFSDEYKQIIRETPHIKYKTSPLMWFLFVLLVILFGALLVISLLFG